MPVITIEVLKNVACPFVNKSLKKGFLNSPDMYFFAEAKMKKCFSLQLFSIDWQLSASLEWLIFLLSYPLST